MLIQSNQIADEYINIYSLTSKKLGIPIFQRFYAWKTGEAKAMLNDILAATTDKNSQFYLLDIIYYKEGEKIMLADGQQRVVTLNLLIKAINNYIDENNLSIEKLKYFDIVYDVPIYDTKYQNTMTNYPVTPFKINYIYFEKWVTDNKENILKISDVIKNQIYVFTKKTNSMGDAFNVFQQINTGGKPLTKDEIINSTIKQFADLYKVEVKHSTKELKKLLTAYYKFIKSSNGDDFDTIKIMSFLKEDVVKDSETFNKFANVCNNIKHLVDNPMTSIINWINRSQLNDILNILAMEDIDVFKKREYLDNVMLPLCLLSIVMTINKNNPGGIIRTLYANVIDSIKKHKAAIDIGVEISKFIDENKQFTIDLETFENSLGDETLSIGIKKALLVIDIINRNTSAIINLDAINLEHIYPKNPSSDWILNGWPATSEEIKKLSSNIGNFLILNEVVNKKIKNKYIDQKVDEYKRIIEKDKAIQTRINSIDFNEFKNKQAEYINKRKKFIANEIYDTFKLAKVIIRKNPSN